MSATENARKLRKNKGGGVPPAQISTFGLAGYAVIHIEETVDGYHLVLRLASEITGCIHCPSTAIKRWGSKIQSFVDEPLHSKPCMAAVDRQRYRCKSCKRYLSAPLPNLHPRRRMTLRLFGLIREWAATSTFAEVARRVGLDEKTIRNVVREKYDAKN